MAIFWFHRKRRGAINSKQLTYLEKYRPKQRLRYKHPHIFKNKCCIMWLHPHPTVLNRAEPDGLGHNWGTLLICYKNMNRFGLDETPLVPKILFTLIVVWILPWLFRDLRLRGLKGYVSLRVTRYGEGDLWPLTLHQDWHPNHASNDCDCLKEPGGVIMWIMDKICALSHSLYFLFLFLQLSYSSLPGVRFLDD